jgi:hypothetical protein
MQIDIDPLRVAHIGDDVRDKVEKKRSSDYATRANKLEAEGEICAALSGFWDSGSKLMKRILIHTAGIREVRLKFETFEVKNLKKPLKSLSSPTNSIPADLQIIQNFNDKLKFLTFSFKLKSPRSTLHLPHPSSPSNFPAEQLLR